MAYFSFVFSLNLNSSPLEGTRPLLHQGLIYADGGKWHTTDPQYSVVHFSLQSHPARSDPCVLSPADNFFCLFSFACSDMLMGQLKDWHFALTGGGQRLLGLLCSISILPTQFLPLFCHLFPSLMLCFWANPSWFISFLVFRALLKHLSHNWPVAAGEIAAST